MERKRAAEAVRLPAEAAASWFEQAEALDVYLEYEFTGTAALSAEEEAVEHAVNELVGHAIAVGGTMHRRDRWVRLRIDRRPGALRLECGAAGSCPPDLSRLTALGAVTELTQYPYSYDLTVHWSLAGQVTP